MGKFLIRVTIIFTSIYFLVSFYCAQFKCVDILSDVFLLLFELCVVVCCFGEKRYHCKHIKYLSLAIFITDTLTRLDNSFDFLTVSQHNLIPIGIISIGILVSTCSAIRHFYKVKRIKNGRKEHYANKTNGNITA